MVIPCYCKQFYTIFIFKKYLPFPCFRDMSDSGHTTNTLYIFPILFRNRTNQFIVFSTINGKMERLFSTVLSPPAKFIRQRNPFFSNSIVTRLANAISLISRERPSDTSLSEEAPLSRRIRPKSICGFGL